MGGGRIVDRLRRRSGRRPGALRASRRAARPAAPDWRRVERLYDEQAIESAVLLAAAERYTNEVERVATEEEGRAVCHAIALGFALRAVEEADRFPAPVPGELAGLLAGAEADAGAQLAALIEAALRLSGDGGVRLEQEPGAVGRLFAPGFEAWRQLARRAREAAAAASLRRTRDLLERAGVADERRAAPALVDYERAFRYGYLVACLEGAGAAPDTPSAVPDGEAAGPGAAATAGAPAPAAGGEPRGAGAAYAPVLISAVDELLARGERLYGLRDTEIALVVGVTHGLGLEAAAAEQKDPAVAGARAGFALRVAEEDAGLAERRLPALTDALTLMEARDPSLVHWDAAQVLAWELVDADGERAAFRLPGGRPLTYAALPEHPGHEPALADLVAALTAAGADAARVERACRFGYALRCAEASLPHGVDRLLRDG
jgi:hypothetical protein